jgi:hypothetical protein
MAADQQQEIGDASAPPRKRQQQYAGPTPISPQPSTTDTSDSTPDNKPSESDPILPPVFHPLLPNKAEESSPIKTPRPDISMGIQDTALISALSAQVLDKTRAKRFLAQLQNTMMAIERGGSEEPLLITVPTQRASDLVFPFAVVEGKAYSTGKQIFEAENQASVSGASGLNIQLRLNELVKRTATGSDVPTPLFFSVCTEGPYHELYAHYTHIEDGVRKFNQTLLEICNGMLQRSLLDFIIVVDNVLRWCTGQFLESVVERLGTVARKAGA